ncbi:MAG: hypothetical protein VX803_05265, partial [Pseudomonadota bacterium]|nr:hypothetical protein [Pseudomonadota bacterium]
MAKAEQNDHTDPMHYIQLWQNVLKETTPLLKEYMTNFQPPELLSNAVDFEDFATMLSEFWAELLQNPDRLYEMQQQYWQDWSKIWQESAER